MGKIANSEKKRKLRALRGAFSAAEQVLMAGASYEGSGYHKRSPGDFGLTPPVSPRPDATLCDEAGVQSVREALELFSLAVKGELACEGVNSMGYPQCLWVAQSKGGKLRVFEFRYGGSKPGRYHGYPLREADPMFDRVCRYLKSRQ